MLAFDDRDAGCGPTCAALDRYVEIEIGRGNPRAELPGVAVHLAACPACRTDHHGLLALIAHDSGKPLA